MIRHLIPLQLKSGRRHELIAFVIVLLVAASLYCSATTHAPQPPSLQLIFVARKGVWLRRNSFRVVLGVMRLSVALSALKTLPLMVSDTVDDDDIVCVCVCVW